ncbi:MAG: methyltransferase domain-containing protein [Desulfobacteraceae bacterium]
MTQLNPSSLADLTLDVSWRKNGIVHHEHFFAGGVNFYRDFFPESPLTKICDPQNLNDTGEVTLKPGQAVAEFDEKLIFSLPLSCVREKIDGDRVQPGRFYPKGLFRGIPGIFSENRTPLRVKEIRNGNIIVDLNHPLAGEELKIGWRFRGKSVPSEERGGTSTDWLQLALDGPGMQVVTQPFINLDFSRRDQQNDTCFYDTDRFVNHIDTRAGNNLSHIYGTMVSDSEQILDLMAGWASHLPEERHFAHVQGLGMNANEMTTNPRLTENTVHNLNETPELPFEDNCFDKVVCSLSVEYLIHPVAVFAQVARVLKPDGKFLVGFSNRWFPEKTVLGWEKLHDFERMGLVTSYFLQSQRFQELKTFSVRGYPRPPSDRYARQMIFSDPIYVVAGTAIS